MKLGNNSRRDYTPLPRLERQSATDVAEEMEELDMPEETTPASPQRPYDFLQPRADVGGENPALAEECSSVIGAGSAWQGMLDTDGSIRLEGRVNGEVKAAGGTVHITEGAEVNATVHAKFVVIAGSFDGKLFCSDRLELRPTSRIKGAITTRLLSVGEGAFIDGEIHMTDHVPDIFAGEPVAAGAASGNGKK